MIYLLDLFGVAVFAITGALAAGSKRLDVFGVVVVAIVTALGGGTIRDLVLGIRPVTWVGAPDYIVVAAIAAVITFFAVRVARVPHRLLLFFDAFGLAFFTVLGCQQAMRVTDAPVIIVMMGVLTGVAGGALRDILCGEIPVILRREIYATASLLGGIIYLLLLDRTGSQPLATAVAIGLILAARLAAIHWHLSLPIFEAPAGNSRSQ